MFLLVLNLLLTQCTFCSGAHILISSISASFGHWNSLLHIAKEALSRDNDHFITFIIDETFHHYLDTITKNPQYHKSKYQIIYTPNEQRLDFANTFEDNNVQVHHGMVKRASISFITKTIFLNHSQSLTPTFVDESLNELMNHKLKRRNIISELQWNRKVDLCLLDAFNFFDMTLCNQMFDIPTVILMPPAVVSKAEYYALRNTFIYFCDPFSLDLYWDLMNGTVMTYKQKWINLITNTVYLLNQKITSRQIIVPILHEFNAILSALDIHKSFMVNDYTNGFADFWDQTVIISTLATPFTPIFYTRARVQQFGFLLYDDDTALDDDLLQWIDAGDVVFISMGSVHTLSEKVMQVMYARLMDHSEQNGYRVLWALQQNIYQNMSNTELQNARFKIVESVQQLEVLKHTNVKLFMTHCGTGGIAEAMYSKTLMMLYPMVADQYMNAQRVETLGVGLLIQDREYMTDLTAIIERLLVDEGQSNGYQQQM
eukprot:275414_1